jgi:hypothetical protein
MRAFGRLLAVAVVGVGLLGAAHAQDDAGMMAAQQAQMASDMAMQATMQANQMANDAAAQASQQAILNANNAAMMSAGCVVPTPKISVKSGTYGSSQTVEVKERMKDADVYYSLHGWTPTAKSHRYSGPFTVDANTQLRVVAFKRKCGVSRVAVADYVIQGSSVTAPVVGADGLLRQGEQVPLLFAQAMSTKDLKAGQAVDLKLAAPIVIGGRTVAAADATAWAIVTSVEPAQRWGRVPAVTFSVTALKVDGVTIPVSGDATAIGDIPRQPFIHPSITIPTDRLLMATVVKDTTLPVK